MGKRGLCVYNSFETPIFLFVMCVHNSFEPPLHLFVDRFDV